KDNIDKYVRRKGQDPQQVLKSTVINRAMKELNINSTDELYTQLSYGGAFQSKVANLLFKYYQEEQKEKEAKQKNDIENLKPEESKQKKTLRQQHDDVGISVKGADNLMIRVAKCCNPVPGDDIIGFITKGRGITVHRTDCVNMTSLPESEKVRFIDVEWNMDELDKTYDADVTVIAKDQKGLFSEISKACDDLDAHITGVNAKTAKDETVQITLTLSIANTAQMQKILRTFRNVSGILEVYRG
ncbi:MAG: bifunctional (p)ppGpp synthetase/guanosine-3',5'-bis(diphosphate) 3'-pyrophosphohydrolase, partial [Firmicutes bacterium]|nr:bifunctional (p)ppGpp synthetase/guanosine-3',5'-bis(diphosphate) 3'-pyrophosphohydrolase [Bacillota bacterium]